MSVKQSWSPGCGGSIEDLERWAKIPSILDFPDKGDCEHKRVAEAHLGAVLCLDCRRLIT